jgi:glycosyltransferase involved in cell wall biosynthesis
LHIQNEQNHRRKWPERLLDRARVHIAPETRNSMKILHVIIGLGVGGAEHMLRRLIESHRGSTEFQHSVVSLTTTGEIGRILLSEGVSVHALEMRGLLTAPTTLVKLARVIKSCRPDIVQTWMYHADLIGGLAARSVGNRRVIWGVRNTDMIKGTSYATFAIRRACALVSRWLPAVIVCAAEASLRSHVAIGYDSSKMTVISNGFDAVPETLRPRARNAIRTQLGYSDGEFVIGCVGRFNFYKDHANFVAAAGLLADKNANARFLMIGNGLDAANFELAHLINRTGHTDRFKLLGYRKDVATFLAALDVFCLPSRSEGFPNVVGEAMSVGLPCVATDVGDVRTLVGDAGIIVQKENAEALREGFERIAEMSLAEREALGMMGQHRVNTEFSMSRVRERFEAIYKSLADQS